MRILFSLYFPTFLLPYIFAQSKKHPSYSSENLLNTNNLIHVPSPPLQIRTMAKDHRVARFLKSEDSNNMPDYDFEVPRPYFVEENIVRRHPKSYNRRVGKVKILFENRNYTCGRSPLRILLSIQLSQISYHRRKITVLRKI